MTGMDYVDTVQEEIVEGMEEEAHGHDHDHSVDHDHSHDDLYSHDLYDDDGHGEEIEYDEHIWTSPVNAMKLVKGIEETLALADPGNRAAYEANAESYLLKLEKLDQEFRDVTANEKRNMIIVGISSLTVILRMSMVCATGLHFPDAVRIRSQAPKPSLTSSIR